MQKVQPIESVIDHIVKVYGFEITPCSIPRSDFQSFKRSIYLLIYSRVSENLFYFLRDKVSPIKYLKIRPDREIWLKKRLAGKVVPMPNGVSAGIVPGKLCEVEIRPIPPEAAIYVDDSKKIFKPINGDGNFKVKVYYPSSDESGFEEFLINTITGCQSIDAHFCDIPEFREILRDYKLNSLGI